MKIGVFDSGLGGLSVVKAIEKELPAAEIIFKNDAAHVPYGTRSIAEIYEFTKPIIKELVEQGCQVVVIACNTVTTNLIDQLRRDFSVPFVGMEPMIKPAASLTKSKTIAVCATARTLQSQRYNWLTNNYAANIKILEPDCNSWATMIETDNLDRRKIKDVVDDVCDQGADVIVLGCTHYHWIEEIIKQIAGNRATVLQPEAPVIKQLSSVLEQLA